MSSPVWRPATVVLATLLQLAVAPGAAARAQESKSPAHWAYAPLTRPEPPAVRDAGWPRNPIDAFVARRLDERGMSPAEEADRRSLIRRLCFDLTGLPPTPQEIERFLADDSAQAYDALADRLLASPHHGERWARHWLDVARYGESDGFEHDAPRDVAWRYRAWVVDALNADLPYDEFARRQIAGDALTPDPAAAIPTGFLVAGPYDRVGHTQLSAARRALARQDELQEIVGTTMQAFLGMTLHCARCHDHKSEPLGQLDYYRVAAALAGVRRGVRDVTPATDDVRRLQRRRDALRRQLEALEEPIRARLRAARGDPMPAISWSFARGSSGLTLHGAARLRDGALVLDGADSYASSPILPFALDAKTLEAWVQLDRPAQPGGGVLSIETVDGVPFDAILYLGGESGQWWAGSDDFLRSEPFGGAAESNAATRPVHIAIVYAADGTITAYRDGRPYGSPYRIEQPMTFEKGRARLLIGRLRSDPGGLPGLSASVRRVAVHDTALSAAAVAQSFRRPVDSISEADLADELTPDQQSRRAAWQAELAAVARQLEARARTGFCTVSAEPDETRVLPRGQPSQQGIAVAAGGVAAIATLSADFDLPLDAPDGARRRRLADWIADRRNAVFARVAANRVWHYHFGRGLVDTPSDFGREAHPSHPDLLDWLASELVASGYRLKHLHRLIVTSATYRQSTRAGDAVRQRDPDNRWLGRMRPRRLEAEAVRDAILAVSGALDLTVGGPGYRDFAIHSRGPTFFYQPDDSEGEGRERRSLYRMWARGGRQPLLEVLDCPDPSTAAPARETTTTPLQALALLNSGLVLRMTDRFAARLREEAGEAVDDRIRLAHELALGRPPTAGEVERLRPLVLRHGLSVLARALFNSHEFLYVN